MNSRVKLEREIIIDNVGNLSVLINAIKIGSSDCGIRGVVIENCKQFMIHPSEQKVLTLIIDSNVEDLDDVIQLNLYA